jgi:hypothetical protein
MSGSGADGSFGGRAADPALLVSVPNAFRHHGGGHGRAAKLILSLNLCSTPFGITEVGTSLPPSAFQNRAQRLSASRRWAHGCPRAQTWPLIVCSVPCDPTSGELTALACAFTQRNPLALADRPARPVSFVQVQNRARIVESGWWITPAALSRVSGSCTRPTWPFGSTQSNRSLTSPNHPESARTPQVPRAGLRRSRRR